MFRDRPEPNPPQRRIHVTLDLPDYDALVRRAREKNTSPNDIARRMLGWCIERHLNAPCNPLHHPNRE